MKSQIIFGVPGAWQDRREIIQRIARDSRGYVMAGQILHEIGIEGGFEVSVGSHDSVLLPDFAVMDGKPADSDLLEAIAAHTSVVYLFADVSEIGSLKTVVRAVAALLAAGGLAVTIMTSGVSHTKESWYWLLDHFNLGPAYMYFVSLAGDGSSYYSRGMKSFGLPDVRIPYPIAVHVAEDILNTFNLYGLVEKPQFAHRDVFSMEEYPLKFWVELKMDDRTDVQSDTYNHFGILDLSLL